MDQIQIRRITADDLEQLQKISRQTFLETFSASNSEENMKSYLDEAFATEKLFAELNNPYSQFYFAELDGTAIGYLKLNFEHAQTEPQDKKAIEIERIYVLKAFQGKKVGQLLYEKAMETARQKNADFIWLGVWEENTRAIQFYKKNGFVAYDKHIFKLGNDAQTDILMKLHLNK